MKKENTHTYDTKIRKFKADIVFIQNTLHTPQILRV